MEKSISWVNCPSFSLNAETIKKKKRLIRSHSHGEDVLGEEVSAQSNWLIFWRVFKYHCSESKVGMKSITYLIHSKCQNNNNLPRIQYMLEDLRSICLNYCHTPSNKILNYAANQIALDLLQIEVQVEQELKEHAEIQRLKKKKFQQCKLILEIVRLIRFCLAKLFHIYEPFSKITREDAEEEDTILTQFMIEKLGKQETQILLKHRRVIRRNPEYTDNLMKIDQFLLEGFVKEDIIAIETRNLRQYFRKRLVEWIQQYAEQKLEELKAEEPQHITCRICDKQFNVDLISQHTTNCQESTELSKQIMELDLQMKQTCEEALKIQQKYNTQKHLLRKKKGTGIYRVKKCSEFGDGDASPRTSLIQQQQEQQQKDFKRSASLNPDSLLEIRPKHKSLANQKDLHTLSIPSLPRKNSHDNLQSAEYDGESSMFYSNQNFGSFSQVESISPLNNNLLIEKTRMSGRISTINIKQIENISQQSLIENEEENNYSSDESVHSQDRHKSARYKDKRRTRNGFYANKSPSNDEEEEFQIRRRGVTDGELFQNGRFGQDNVKQEYFECQEDNNSEAVQSSENNNISDLSNGNTTIQNESIIKTIKTELQNSNRPSVLEGKYKLDMIDEDPSEKSPLETNLKFGFGSPLLHSLQKDSPTDLKLMLSGIAEEIVLLPKNSNSNNIAIQQSSSSYSSAKSERQENSNDKESPMYKTKNKFLQKKEQEDEEEVETCSQSDNCKTGNEGEQHKGSANIIIQRKSQDIFKDEQSKIALQDRLNSLAKKEDSFRRDIHRKRDEEQFRMSTLTSSSSSQYSTPMGSLNDSEDSPLSSASSYNIEERIEVEEKGIIETLESLKPISQRVQELEKYFKKTYSALKLSRSNSQDMALYLSNVKRQSENSFDSNQSPVVVNNNELNYYSAGEISKRNSNSNDSPENSPLKKEGKKASRFGLLKRAQTLIIKDLNIPFQNSEENGSSPAGSKKIILQQVVLSSKVMKSINAALELVVSYGEKISKRVDIISIDQDLKTQNSLKFSLPEIIQDEDVFAIMKKMIHELSERINLQFKIQKLTEADEKLLKDQSIRQKSKENLKKRLSLLGDLHLGDEQQHHVKGNGHSQKFERRSSRLLSASSSQETKLPPERRPGERRLSDFLFKFPPSSINEKYRKSTSYQIPPFSYHRQGSNSFPNFQGIDTILEETKENKEKSQLAENLPQLEPSMSQISHQDCNSKLSKNDDEITEDSFEIPLQTSTIKVSPAGLVSMKHVRTPSRFLKSPCTFKMLVMHDLHSIDPLVGNPQILDSLRKKAHFIENNQQIRRSSSNISYPYPQGGHRDQIQDHKKKKRSRIEQKNILLKNSLKKSKIISNSMNSEHQSHLPYQKEQKDVNNAPVSKISRMKIGFKEDDTLEAAMARYEELRKQTKSTLIAFDSDLESSDEEDSSQRAYYSDTDVRQFSANDVQFTQQGVSLHDFEFKQVLGVGAFGAVWLVTKKTTKDQYALKIIDCSQQMDRNQQENLRAETNVFAILKGDHVVKALYSFQFEDYLCFVLDYMNGGDFGQILRNYGRLDESIVRFYAAEIILAVEYLHSQKIVHRDLKPENILLDTTGHIKLADFGLSEVGLTNKLNKKEELFTEDHETKKQKIFNALKLDFGITIEAQNHQSLAVQVNLQSENEWGATSMKPVAQKKNRVVGTPDYIPPEVINGESISNPSIDWWSLGVIIYEFIAGIPPFNDNSVEEIFNNIKKGHIEWPEVGYQEDEMTPEAQDLIKQLLISDHTKRLGAKSTEEIKNHAFFKGILWDKIKKQSAPLVSMIVQEQTENEPESENQLQKKELEKIKLQNMLRRNDTPRRATTHLQGMQNLWRVDLLASINMEEAEKRKTEAILKETQQKEKVKKLQRLASTLVECS